MGKKKMSFTEDGDFDLDKALKEAKDKKKEDEEDESSTEG